MPWRVPKLPTMTENVRSRLADGDPKQLLKDRTSQMDLGSSLTMYAGRVSRLSLCWALFWV